MRVLIFAGPTRAGSGAQPPRRQFGLSAYQAVRSIGVTLAIMALAACTQTAPKPVRTVEPIPLAFSAEGGAPLPDRWWEHLGDEDLSTLVERALAGSPTLRQSWDRLRQARAALRVERADELPSVDFNGQGRNRFTEDTNLGDDYTLGLAASYELDLWGRVRAASAASAFDLHAREADVLTAAITLSAEVAENWYTLVEQRAIRDLRRAQIETNEQVLDLTEFRFRQGQAALADVLRQRQLVEQRQGELEDNLSEISVRQNAIAVLAGRAPGTPELPGRARFGTLPPLPATGLPIELLRRRPDVREAFLAIQAADARVAVAIAEQYPRFDLTADYSTSATRLDDLFSNWLLSLATQVVAPVFDAGRRAAEVERQRALVSEALNVYEDTVLQALREVEDALVRERRQRAKLESLLRQRGLADQVVERLTDRYTQGQEDFLDVLNALITQQDVARQVITARRQLQGFRIDLARALAGGWEMTAPETRRLDAEAGET